MMMETHMLFLLSLLHSSSARHLLPTYKLSYFQPPTNPKITRSPLQAMVEEDLQPRPLDLSHLKVLSVVGRGAKGIVFLVRDQASNETLALKAISKASIKHDGSGYKRIWFERDVLRSFQHPLLPSLGGVVVSEKIVGFAMDYCSGGNLNSLRKKQTEKMFSDEIIRFYAAELVLALEYLHGLGIAYRDLKPENVLIQENGHLMLVDFDLSTKLSKKISTESPEPHRIVSSTAGSGNRATLKKKRFSVWCNSGISPEDSVSPTKTGVDSGRSDNSVSAGKSNSFVGTEEYVAPEMILGNGHDFAVDWWGLGIVLYEMLYGRTPFRGIDRKETFYRIFTKTPELVGEPTALRDLIGKLLEKDPTNRIGLEGIKGHDFFRGVNWDSILRVARPPFIPGRSPEEDAEGIREIDVESFVQGVLDDGEMQRNNDINNNKNNGNNKDFLVF